MSEENVEVVRRWFEEWPDGRKDIQAFVAQFWEPDGDYYPIRGFPEARPCHGREEIATFFAGYLAAWDSYTYTVEEAIPVSGDRVLMHGDIHAAGRTSGLVLEGQHIYHCFWLRHGRFIRQEDHRSAQGALRALGLSGDCLEAAGLGE